MDQRTFFRIHTLSADHQQRLQRYRIDGNLKIVRVLVALTLVLAGVLALLTSPLMRKHPVVFPLVLEFNLFSLVAVSLAFLLYLLVVRKQVAQSNVPTLVYASALALVAFGFAVRDFCISEDNASYLLGAISIGMLIGAPYWFYWMINVVGLTTLLTGVGLLRPDFLTPDRIGLWVVYSAMGIMIGYVLETRRRESYYREILLQEANAALTEVSFRDPLTGAYNRRFFHEIFGQQLELSNRKGRTFCLVMIDLDRFKSVNDTYGHQTGDEVLKHTVALLHESLRTTDTLSRFGGEEFAILLVDTPLDRALQVAERIRERRAATAVPELPVPVTMSLGVAEHREGESGEDLLKRADALLYKAKANGRNRSES